MRRLLKHLAGIALALGIPATAAPNAAKCGTYAIIQRHLAAAASGGPSYRIAVTSLSSRTLATPHFAIRYTMGPNVHRPRLTALDSAGVLRQADSILQTLPLTLTPAQRDQAVNAGLDSVSAPAPVFVQRAAVYFERAYAYYSDSLGMSMPQGGGMDQYFTVDSTVFAADAGKYIVDIADITTLDPELGGATYGGTYGPADVFPSGSILLENDFLYDVSLQANGQVTGTPIQAYLNNRLLHDYTRDWDLGIKITASHEFYHAVQYVYTPDPFSNYHAWYELSAVGMEERLVPESDDYYQYLPCIFSHHDAISLLSIESGGCPTYVMYGNATFHQYLTRDFGRRFDVSVWSALHTNGNNLPTALTTMLSGFGAQWDTTYAAYTAALATASASATASSCSDTTAPIFTRDLPCWPQPSFDTLPKASGSGSLLLTEGALTYRLLKSSPAKAGFVNSTNLRGALVAGNTAGYGAVPVSLSGGFELFSTPVNTTLYVDASNPSFTQSRQLSVSSQNQSPGFTALPNPVPLQAPVFFPAPSGSTAPLTLTVVSESGRRVAELPLNSGFWSWNLRDERGLPASPGAYYYRIPGQPVKSLLLLSH